MKGEVDVITPLPGGDFLVGGRFSLAGGTLANNVARYSPSTRAWSALGSGVTNAPSSINTVHVRAAVSLPGGDMIVGGVFSFAGETPATSIARYSPATGRWSALAPGITGTVRALATLTDGSVLVGGSFLTSDIGANKYCIARYDPLSDTWQSIDPPRSGPSQYVFTLLTLANSEVIVGGAFDTIGGISASNIARFNPSTGQWLPMGLGVSGASSASVSALSLLPDGSILVGGFFQSAGLLATASLARYTPSSDTWSSFAAGLGSSSTPSVSVLSPLPGGDVLVAGQFSSAGSLMVHNLAVFNPMTQAWSLLGQAEFDSFPGIQALAPLPGGDVLAGGSMSVGNGTPSQGFLRFSASAHAWEQPSAGTNAPVTPIVLPNGETYATGSFTTIQGAPANHLAHYSPASGTWTDMGLNTQSSAHAIAALPGGDLVAVGSFSFDGGPLVQVARFHAATHTWSPLNWPLRSGTTPSLPWSLTSLPDGDVVAIGAFESAGSVPVHYLARWHPATDTWTSLGYIAPDPPASFVALQNGDYALSWVASATSTVYRYRAPSGSLSTTAFSGAGGAIVQITALTADPTTSDLICGGWFNVATPAGVNAHHIMRILRATNAPVPLGPGLDDRVSSIAVLPSGDIIASGAFTHAGGTPVRSIARYNPTQGTWSPLGLGLDGAAALAALPNGDLLAGGDFATAGGLVSAYFARYTFAQTCPADLDCSGALEVADIFAFITAWLGNDSAADFNHANGIEVQDIFDFLNAWFAGC